MADEKISAMPAAGALAGNEIVAGVQLGNNVKITVSAIAALTVPGLVLLSELTPSGVSSVTFSSIPATYRDLIVKIRGRSTNVSVNVTPQITFNGDVGANYDVTFLEGTNAAAAGQFYAANNIGFSRLPAASAPANMEGGIEIKIFDYKGTTFFKSINIDGGSYFGTSGNNAIIGKYTAQWRSTAAITSLAIATGGGNFVAGSVVSLYGSL